MASGLQGTARLPPDLAFEGRTLNRPECVLTTRDGSRYTSDWRGGVCHSKPDGQEVLYRAKNLPHDLKPNGIALLQDGSFLCADLGVLGGVWRLDRNGEASPFLTEMNGVPLPPCNFVSVDQAGRCWLSVSTTHLPRQTAQRPDVADGYIVCLEDGCEPKIVAQGLGYANEVLLGPGGEWLYVNETCARRLSRFPVREDGTLGERQTVAAFGAGTFPDGLAFDEAGGIWIVSIVSNRIFRLSPEEELELVLEDSKTSHLEAVERAFQNGHMSPQHFSRSQSQSLRNVSSIAFGGPDRRQVWLGCLDGNALATFRVPWAGVKPVHWEWGIDQVAPQP